MKRMKKAHAGRRLVCTSPIERNSKDSALLLTLQPGLYIVSCEGVNATEGVALVEIYEIPE